MKMNDRVAAGHGSSWRHWLALAVTAAMLSACGGGGESAPPQASAAQRAPKAACDFGEVVVTVSQIRLRDEGGWREIALPQPRPLSLTDPGRGILAQLGLAPIQPGRYGEVRLVLAPAPDGSLLHRVDAGPDGAQPLLVPGGAQSGLKLRVAGQVPDGQQGELFLSGFDACAAVHQAGQSGRFMLQPELQAQVQPVGATGTDAVAVADGEVLAVPGGGFVQVVTQGFSSWLVERHGADGSAVGASTAIVATGPAAEFQGELTPLAGGGFVASWIGPAVEFQRFGGSAYEFYAQPFAADGTPLGAAQLIGQVRPFWRWISKPAALPQAAALAGGGYVLAWPELTSGFNLYARRYTATGVPMEATQEVATDVAGLLELVGLSTGGHLVAWDGGLRAYGPDGLPLAPAQPGPAWSPLAPPAPSAIAALAGGGAVLAQLLSSWNVYTHLTTVAPAGTLAGASRLADESSPADPGGAHAAPALAGLADGGYVAVWVESDAIHARRFAADGAPLGPETVVSGARTVAATPRPQVVPLAGGGFMVFWTAVEAGGATQRYARAFGAGALLAP